MEIEVRKHYKFKQTCPSCGARLRSFVQEQQHTNGYWNQIATYECGYKLHFIPNFMGVRVECRCEKSPETLEIIEKRKEVLGRVINYVRKLRLDDQYAAKILHELERLGEPHNITQGIKV